ncbi:uncharacterized protein LOC119385221 [Rhipicephalus sanguineus]|uniref:uncharacterized protein LOC119385221 n=1 Tax=Rhipicephalus sanguineus TaxID=34632 RepID=UPI001894C8EB|nr:uncharacterized protein LOC119385221 [Rhipicephalus sanguineus]
MPTTAASPVQSMTSSEPQTDSTAPAADQQSIDDIVYQLRPGFYGLNVSSLPYWLLGCSAVVAALTLVALLCVCFKRRVLPRTPQAPTGRTTIALACPSSLGLHNPTDIVVCPSCSGSMHEAAFHLDPTAVTLWNLPLSRSLNPSPHLGAAPAPPRVAHAAAGDDVARADGRALYVHGPHSEKPTMRDSKMT